MGLDIELLFVLSIVFNVIAFISRFPDVSIILVNVSKYFNFFILILFGYFKQNVV